jgi:hypothetical protein
MATSNSKVKSMAKSESGKDKSKDKPKAKPPHASHDAGKKEKKAKPAPDASAKDKEAPPEKEKTPPPPRPPADPRLKFIKKFHGKFLPRGPLRDRHKALMTRWNSGEDHGDVTVEELKSLHDDWKADRAKRRRPVVASG